MGNTHASQPVGFDLPKNSSKRSSMNARAQITEEFAGSPKRSSNRKFSRKSFKTNSAAENMEDRHSSKLRSPKRHSCTDIDPRVRFSNELIDSDQQFPRSSSQRSFIDSDREDRLPVKSSSQSMVTADMRLSGNLLHMAHGIGEKEKIKSIKKSNHRRQRVSVKQEGRKRHASQEQEQISRSSTGKEVRSKSSKSVNKCNLGCGMKDIEKMNVEMDLIEDFMKSMTSLTSVEEIQKMVMEEATESTERTYDLSDHP